ncbi:MAG: glycosyltransferase [Alphaproteobacteria bacterium]|nr:glycosyltransferase [Alphaproteobacteria bacterium]
MKIPTVSVIIPVYKTEKFLSRCLDSVLNQTFKDFEIICVNDGSPDNSGNILKEYANKYKNIEIITQKNAGVSTARNTGISAARGKFVYFLDSDDFIHPQLLEITHGLAIRHNADMVTFVWDKDLERQNGAHPNIFPKFQKYDSIDKIRVIISDNPIFHIGKRRYNFSMYVKSPLKLFRRELFNKIPFLSGLYWEDLIHTATLVKKNPRTVFTNENLYYYSEFSESITRARVAAKHINDYHTAYNIIYDLYKDEPKRIKNIFIKYLFNDARTIYKRIKRMPKESQTELWPLFREWLCDAKARGWLRLGRLSITRVIWFIKLKKFAK